MLQNSLENDTVIYLLDVGFYLPLSDHLFSLKYLQVYIKFFVCI